jgi:hypothetical protein
MAGGTELVGELSQVGEGVDLPGQVVQPDGGAPRAGGAGRVADGEEAEVVVVGGVGCLEERRAAEALGQHVQGLEAQDVAVELEAALDVAHVEHGMVQAVDRHTSN